MIYRSRLFAFFIFAFLFLAANSAAAQERCPVNAPKPVKKVEGKACPLSYFLSANYCVPSAMSSMTVYEIPLRNKSTICPMFYFSRDGYCVANTREARNILIKIGANCPTGYLKNRDYCIHNCKIE